jgi:hypothetical protein
MWARRAWSAAMLFEPRWAIGGAAGVGAPLTRRLLSNDILPVCREATHGRRPDVAALDEAWKEVLGMRQQHLNLARRYFSLTLDDVESSLGR